MKKYILPIFLGSALILNSCGDPDPSSDGDGTTNDSTAVSSEVDLKGLREFDMSPFDLNVIVYIPEKFYMDQEAQVEKFVQPTIEHNEGEALWDITMPGEKHFHMVIEDWGDIKQTVAEEQAIHKDQNIIYDYLYNEQGEDYMLFSRMLKSENSTLEDQDLSKIPTHHFYVVKQIDGYYITAKSYTMQDFHQVSARTMMNCARGMKSTK